MSKTNMVLETGQIQSINKDGVVISMGDSGITEMYAYWENAERTQVPYIAIIKGRNTFKRVYAIGWNIEYKEQREVPDPRV